MRLCSENFSPEVLYQIMGALFATTEIPSPTSDEARTLISFAEESIEEQRECMPVFDEWGIVPAGHRGPRPNPWAAEPECVEVPPEQEEAEETEEDSGGEDASGEGEASRGASSAGEDEASTGAKPVGEDGAAMGANPSRGSVSSSRSLPAGVASKCSPPATRRVPSTLLAPDASRRRRRRAAAGKGAASLAL